MNISYNVTEKTRYPRILVVTIRDNEVFYDHVCKALGLAFHYRSPKLKIIFGGRVAQFSPRVDLTVTQQAHRICSRWNRSKPIKEA